LCINRSGRRPESVCGNGYAGLSDFALYYIGGVIKHARALNAITIPVRNSYKRLCRLEAPINLAYSAKNRSASAAFRTSPVPRRRVEVRFPTRRQIPTWRLRRC